MIKHYYRIGIVCVLCVGMRPTACLGTRTHTHTLTPSYLYVWDERANETKQTHSQNPPERIEAQVSTKWILEFDTDNAFDSESYVNRKITANALFQWFLFHSDRFSVRWWKIICTNCHVSAMFVCRTFYWLSNGNVPLRRWLIVEHRFNLFDVEPNSG